MCYHLSTTLIGGHGIAPLLFTIQHTYAGRSVHLVCREYVEIGIEALHIDSKVGNALRTVYLDGNVVGVSISNSLFYGVDCAQYIRCMHYADQSRTLGKEVAKCLHVQLAALIDGDDTQFYIFTTLQQLPRNNVGVVLHRGNNHLVAIVQKCFAKGVCHKVYRLGSTACEDYLVAVLCIDKALYSFAGILVCIGSLLAQRVHTAVHIGVYATVAIGNAIDDTLRVLRCGSVVEVYEGLAVYLSTEYGELCAYGSYIQHSIIVFVCAWRIVDIATILRGSASLPIGADGL